MAKKKRRKEKSLRREKSEEGCRLASILVACLATHLPRSPHEIFLKFRPLP